MTDRFLSEQTPGDPAVTISLSDSLPEAKVSGIESVRAVCYRCERDLPISDFAVDRSKASGRKSICRVCDRAKAREYYGAHRDELRAEREKLRAEREKEKGFASNRSTRTGWWRPA